MTRIGCELCGYKNGGIDGCERITVLWVRGVFRYMKSGATNNILVESVMPTMRYSSLVAVSGFVFGCNTQYMNWCVDYWGVRTECWWFGIGV